MRCVDMGSTYMGAATDCRPATKARVAIVTQAATTVVVDVLAVCVWVVGCGRDMTVENGTVSNGQSHGIEQRVGLRVDSSPARFSYRDHAVLPGSMLQCAVPSYLRDNEVNVAWVVRTWDTLTLLESV